MPRFTWSKKSIEHLNQLDPRLVATLSLAIRNTKLDFGITDSYRGRPEQEEAYRDKRSKLRFPESKHNILPSLAFDIVAMPGGVGTYTEHYYPYLAGILHYAASIVNDKMLPEFSPFILTWGGNWLNHNDFNSGVKPFNDWCHFQLDEVENE